MVQLAQAGGHFAAAGAGGGDHHQRAAGFNVIVAAIAFVAYNALYIAGIAGNLVVAVRANAHAFQTVLESLGGGLARKLGQAHAAHHQAHTLKSIDQAQHIQIIGDAVVAAHLVAFDILGADHDHDLGLILELQQHLQLGIRLKAGQHAGGMVIVEQLAAEFQIQLIVKLGNAFTNVLGLHFQILFVVKTDLHGLPLFLLVKNSRALPLKYENAPKRRRFGMHIFRAAC